MLNIHVSASLEGGPLYNCQLVSRYLCSSLRYILSYDVCSVAATAVCRVMLNIHKTATFDDRLSTRVTADATSGAFTTRLTISGDCPSIMTIDSYKTSEDDSFIANGGGYRGGI